jgi:hypothetical protein
LDESYKYYPKVLAAGRIYTTYKTDHKKFKENIQQYISAPFTRKPSLAEEYPWFGDKQYNDKDDIKNAMENGELYGAKKTKLTQESIEYHNIGQYTKDRERKELMKMSSKSTWGLVSLLISYLGEKLIINSLTRDGTYNDLVYNK